MGAEETAREQNDALSLMRRRYSCRTYDGKLLEPVVMAELAAVAGGQVAGPFGSQPRISLVSASDGDRGGLRRIGTYGFISKPAVYLAGIARHADGVGALEDVGYVLERAVLSATGLGLGTVWLGGTFTKGRFRRQLKLDGDESLPAVIALGYPAERARSADAVIRRGASADRRLPWHELFFEVSDDDGLFDLPLTREASGRYSTALEMVQLGPSASNKQPWRVVREASLWHLYLRRTPGYRRRNRLVGVADMQRLDLGIAMCHFELACRHLGIVGRWVFKDPSLPLPDALTCYVASWREA